MAGHGGPRPGSGRPSKVDEALMGNLTIKALTWAAENWDSLCEESKMKIVVSFGTRYIPQVVRQETTLTIDERKSDLNERLKCIGLS